jgi:hypothetical protein
MILHHSVDDYYTVFEWVSAADDIGMSVVAINYDSKDGQWHVLIRSADLDAGRARRRWETAVEKRRMEKS